MRNKWCSLFHIQLSNNDWGIIFTRKIKNVIYKKFSEFNFKLLNGILPSGYILNKWNNSIPGVCDVCNKNDTNVHMLFDCLRLQPIWLSIGQVLQIQLQWKDIVIGLNENNTVNIAKNNILTIVAFSIYATWVKFHQPNQDIIYKQVNLHECIRNYLIYYNKIYKQFDTNKEWYNIFNVFTNKVIAILRI